MNKNITWFLTAICIVLIFLIHNKMQESLTIQNYLIETYLHIALALAIVGTTWSCMTNHDVIIERNHRIMLFVVSLGALSAVFYTSNDQMVAKYAAWTILVTSLAITTHIFVKLNIENKTLIKTGLMSFAIVSIFTYLAFVMEPTFFLNWGMPLTYALLGVIVVEVVDRFFIANTSDELITLNKTWNYAIIALFCGFILHDTQKIITNGKIINEMCESKSQLMCADYPAESLAVFLDILNLFQRVTLAIRN